MAVHVLVAHILEKNEVYNLGLLDLRNDVVFKAFFGDSSNNRLLLHFLNAIMGNVITSVELTDPFIELAHSADKSSVMDLRVVTNQGEQIDIEMQLRGHRAFNERMLIYWAKMYASQGEAGQEYEDLKKAVQIIIANFNFLSKDHFHSMFQLIDREDGSIFSNHAEIHVLELKKLQAVRLRNPNALEQWLLFFKGDKQVKEEIAMESPIMKEAYEEIKRLSQDPKTRALAISREIFINDQLQRELDARADGREEGKEEGKEEIILNMLEQNIPKETIAKLTKIPLEEVIRIIEANPLS